MDLYTVVHKAQEVLKVLAEIPIEEMSFSGLFRALADMPDDTVVHAWNCHQITVGDVKRARQIVKDLEDCALPTGIAPPIRPAPPGPYAGSWEVGQDLAMLDYDGVYKIANSLDIPTAGKSKTDLIRDILIKKCSVAAIG